MFDLFVEVAYLSQLVIMPCFAWPSFDVSHMIDDQDLGFIANFLGIFIFALVIAYHYVTADPKYEGN
ncbi:hypothetical protein EZV62_016409 [Acer yangbiense]|uniref:Dolichyl-diphosphooligosaccharide--protein glycosyltransferase subunit 4 n=1 Tax=Acer yangbiense TaxID=1000413 RepID=A0A5C7HNE0_9ROSI|nr:hypothetical protein EZV62_016409 [Acer yangbiense]